MVARHLFSVFDVTRQVFFETPLSLGIVNLKPLRPGHVLIISKRVVPRLSDLNHAEVSDLFQSVQRVGRVVEKAFKAEALNIAVQDGASAGQSVPHVHVHIIPRLRSDFGGEPDNVYPALENSERNLEADLAGSVALEAGGTVPNGASGTGASGTRENGDAGAAVNGNGTVGTAPTAVEREVAQRRRETGWQVPKDEDRRPRTMHEMEEEAQWLASLFPSSSAMSGAGAGTGSGTV